MSSILRWRRAWSERRFARRQLATIRRDLRHALHTNQLLHAGELRLRQLSLQIANLHVGEFHFRRDVCARELQAFLLFLQLEIHRWKRHPNETWKRYGRVHVDSVDPRLHLAEPR